MRIDRYWKQAAAGLLAIMTLTMTGGNLDSLAMTNSQPLKAQGQMLSSPDKIIIRDEGDNAQSSQAAAASQPVIQTKAQIAAFGEVTTPKTDTTSLFGAGRLTMLANHDTAAQLLSVIIETGEGGLIVVDGGWTNNADYLLNQIKQKGGHVQAWASIGYNVTFGDNREQTVEINLLDFEEEIYGETMTVFWHAYLRPELKFDSAEALVDQLHQDALDTQAYFDQEGLEEMNEG